MRIAARRAGGLAVVDWTADATPSVPRVDDSARIAFLVWLESTLRRRKPALICLESTLQLPYMRRLEAYKIVEEPRIVDWRPLRPLMPLESTPHSRLEGHKPVKTSPSQAQHAYCGIEKWTQTAACVVQSLIRHGHRRIPRSGRGYVSLHGRARLGHRGCGGRQVRKPAPRGLALAS